jgi:hypothetical protein
MGRRSTSASAFEPRRSAIALLALSILTSRSARADERDVCVTAAEHAQSLSADSKLIEAQRELIVCSRAVCPTVVQSDCVGWLDEVRRKMPTFIVHARAAGRDVGAGRVYVDDALVQQELHGRPFALNPGPHVIRIEADGYRPERIDAVAIQAQKDRVLEVTLGGRNAGAPSPGERPRSLVPTWILGGAGVVALGSFAVFEAIGQSDYRSLRDGCGATSTCAPGDVDDARGSFVGAGISLAAAGVLFGAATLFALLR